MRWPWQKRVTPVANTTVSIGNPALAGYFSPGGLVDLSGVAVNEHTATGLSAFYRALMVISGTLASLPLISYTGGMDGGRRKRVSSVFDAPDGIFDQTPFEWKESLFLHQLLHGRAGALKLRTLGGAGSVARLALVADRRGVV
jgi:phage portal protein BeeE